MKLIDCNCMIGCATVNHAAMNHENCVVHERVKEAKNADELISEMDYCGISQALVGHQMMIDLNAAYGNERIIEEVTGYPDRLLPTWTILPPIVDDSFAPDSLWERMKKRRICALRAYPKANRYLLNAITMGELLEVLDKCQVPLILIPEDGYESIYGVMKEFPTLTVFLTAYGTWSPLEYVLPLMRAYPNIYLGICDLESNGSIEKVVNKFGSERLLYDTAYPINCMGGTIALLRAAGISDDARENIAFRNIERVLKEVKI